MDPFASIDLECGKISRSQQDLLLHAPFIGDSQRSSDALFPSSSSDEDAANSRQMRPADAPILICSLPDSVDVEVTRLDSTDPGLGFGFSKEITRPKTPAPDPSEFYLQGRTDLGFLDSGMKKSTSSKRRLIAESSEEDGFLDSSSEGNVGLVGGGETSKSAQEEVLGFKNPQFDPNAGVEKVRFTNDAFEKYRYQSLELLKDAIGNPKADSGIISRLRKLPTSMDASSTGGVRTPAAPVAIPAADSGKNSDFPANLLDVIKGFSGNPNRRFEDTDFLEIAAMKGIDFPPPRWWRPGGYEAKKQKPSK